MSKSREKTRICAMCNRVCQTVEHHLIFGSGMRQLADEDDLIIDLCEECHTSASKLTEQIHSNVAAERLSKMLGQMMYERNQLAKMLGGTMADCTRTDYAEIYKDEVKASFMKRYGRSFL